MKKTDQELDCLIRSSVQSINLKHPELQRSPVGQSEIRGKNLLTKTIVMLASAAIVTILLLPPSQQPKTSDAISEIKTELTLHNKNIKILWVQKPDFKLPESMRGGKKS